jgi:peptide/nickel transport system permease protein
MVKFLLRRLVNYVVLVVLATSLAYVLAASTLNTRANYEGRNPPPPAAVVNATLDDLNANNETPVVERYGRWVKGVLHGNFGKTPIAADGVGAEMKRRVGVSLRLLLLGSIIGSTFGVLAGVISAIRQYKATDHLITLGSFLLLSTPVFLLAILLKVYAVRFNHWIGSDFLLYTGEKNPTLVGGFWEHFLDRVRHLILPTLSLALGQIAFYSRYQRNSMLDVLGSDFLRTAQAKGLRRGQALFKHGLRTALIPMATFFAYNFGLLIVGATFTEKIFTWHGMGEWFVDSVTTHDVNAVAAVTLFVAVMVLISGLLSDIAYAALDPRVRIR